MAKRLTATAFVEDASLDKDEQMTATREGYLFLKQYAKNKSNLNIGFV